MASQKAAKPATPPQGEPASNVEQLGRQLNIAHTPKALAPQPDNALTPNLSNSLTDMAARIRGFHEATVEGLKRSVENGIAAGELLIEAKDQLKHGQWLPWLRDNCSISERSAQLYMRLAKNRAEIEASAKSATDADLTMTEVAALLMLSSDAKKLIQFVKSTEGLDAEQIVQAALDQRVALLGVVDDKEYRVFAHCTSEGERDWHLFTLFLCLKQGYYVDGAAAHVEYLSQKQFMDPDEWLGSEGARFRRSCGYRNPEMGQRVLRAWAAFKERPLWGVCSFRCGFTRQSRTAAETSVSASSQYRERTQAEIDAQTSVIHEERGPSPPPKISRRRRRVA